MRETKVWVAEGTDEAGARAGSTMWMAPASLSIATNTIQKRMMACRRCVPRSHRGTVTKGGR